MVINASEQDKIVELHNQGLSIIQIATKTGHGKNTVHRILRKHFCKIGFPQKLKRR
jgi:IS30 family transposase